MTNGRILYETFALDSPQHFGTAWDKLPSNVQRRYERVAERFIKFVERPVGDDIRTGGRSADHVK